MFTVTLFKIAKTEKQPKCSSMDEWIKKMWHFYIHNGILFSHKKEWNPAICNNMDEPQRHYAECNKSDTERQILIC